PARRDPPPHRRLPGGCAGVRERGGDRRRRRRHRRDAGHAAAVRQGHQNGIDNTVTVDDELVEQVAAAVEAGESESVSAWINQAMEECTAHERQLAVWDELIAEYEAEHGAFTDEELAAQAQADRDEAAALREQLRRELKRGRARR